MAIVFLSFSTPDKAFIHEKHGYNRILLTSNLLIFFFLTRFVPPGLRIHEIRRFHQSLISLMASCPRQFDLPLRLVGFRRGASIDQDLLALVEDAIQSLRRDFSSRTGCQVVRRFPQDRTSMRHIFFEIKG